MKHLVAIFAFIVKAACVCVVVAIACNIARRRANRTALQAAQNMVCMANVHFTREWVQENAIKTGEGRYCITSEEKRREYAEFCLRSQAALSVLVQDFEKEISK